MQTKLSQSEYSFSSNFVEEPTNRLPLYPQPVHPNNNNMEDKKKNLVVGRGNNGQIPRYHFFSNLPEQNVFIFSIAMFLTFAAFNTSQNIATSVSARVGSISLAILYGVNTISCLIAPNIINHHISSKTAIFIGAITYALFVASYIYLIDIVLYTTSAILGVGAAFLWIGEGTFVTLCSNEFEYGYMLPFNSELGYFNGVFWFIFQFNQFLGNLLAALLLQFNVPEYLLFVILTVIGFTGVIGFLFLKEFPKNIILLNNNNDNEGNQRNFGDISRDKAINVNSRDNPGSAYDDIGNNNQGKSLDSMSLYEEYHPTDKYKKTVDPILTMKMWFDPNFWVILPITIYSGVAQGFEFGEFGALIDSDSHTFYALASFGLSDAICCSIFGKLSDHVGRLPIIFIAIMSHASVYAYLYFYHIPQSELYKYLIVGAILGIGDAGFNTQILTLYPILLGDRAEAFANFNFWQSLSSCWCFVWHSLVGFKTKVIAYVIVLILAGIPLFFTAKGRNAARSKKKGGIGH